MAAALGPGLVLYSYACGVDPDVPISRNPAFSIKRTDARAMLNALQALKNDELSKVGELGINWSEFNELIGVRRWRQLEKEFGPGKCGLQYRKHRL